MEIETQSKKGQKRLKEPGRNRAKRFIAIFPNPEEFRTFLSKSKWIEMLQDTSFSVELPDNSIKAYVEFANKETPDLIEEDCYNKRTDYFKSQGEDKMTAAEWRTPREDCNLKLAIMMARFNTIIDDFEEIEFDFYDFSIDKTKKL